MKEKVFCGGLFCRRENRRRCHSCDTYSCDQCSIDKRGHHYCIDCGVRLEWEDLKKDLKKDWDDLDKKPDHTIVAQDIKFIDRQKITD